MLASGTIEDDKSPKNRGICGYVLAVYALVDHVSIVWINYWLKRELLMRLSLSDQERYFRTRLSCGKRFQHMGGELGMADYEARGY